MSEKENMIKKIIDMGMAETEEEALKVGIENGWIQEGSGGGSFLNGLSELVLANGARNGNIYKFSKKHKKSDVKFEEGHFYLGSKIVKDKESGDFIEEESTSGIDCGESPKIIPVVRYFKGSFYNASNPSMSINTTMAKSLGKKDQEENMIDTKTKKTVPELYETGKYDKSNKDAKIKWVQIVGAVVETDEGWKPCYLTKTLGSFDHDSIHKAFDKGGLPFSTQYEFETKDGPSSLIYDWVSPQDVSQELAKDIQPLIKEVTGTFMDTYKSQQNWIKSLRGEESKESSPEEEGEENDDLDGIFNEDE